MIVQNAVKSASPRTGRGQVQNARLECLMPADTAKYLKPHRLACRNKSDALRLRDRAIFSTFGRVGRHYRLRFVQSAHLKLTRNKVVLRTCSLLNTLVMDTTDEKQAIRLSEAIEAAMHPD